MKKQFLIILSILLIAVVFVVYFLYNYQTVQILSQKEKQEYEKYYGKEILGTELISIINKTIDKNEKNSIQKDGIYYIENEENSKKIYIKFSETDKIIQMEEIAQKETENFVKYFATASFKCSKIEYHTKTNLVKTLYFEQI